MGGRLDPDAVTAAHRRLTAMTGSGETGYATRRTAGRRTPPGDERQAQIAALSDETVLAAAEPWRLDRLARLAAAITLARDIAAVIDRAGREALENYLGSDLRRLAISVRDQSGPRRMLTGAALQDALEADERAARHLWCRCLPKGISTTDLAPSEGVPALSEAEQIRLKAALDLAQALLTNTALRPRPDKELAA